MEEDVFEAHVDRFLPGLSYFISHRVPQSFSLRARIKFLADHADDAEVFLRDQRNLREKNLYLITITFLNTTPDPVSTLSKYTPSGYSFIGKTKFRSAISFLKINLPL